MSANDHQIGGDHYRSGYNHWDMVVRLGMDYLAGNATKYVSRWNKKNDPLNDLMKARHYVDKLIENIYLVKEVHRPLRFIQREVNAFCTANKLGTFESDAIMRLATWETERDLVAARNCIDHLIQSLTTHDVREASAVPASDSNKHADRITANGN